MNRANLGHRLRAVRQARGYTLADVATLSGLSKSFLSMLETGKTNVSAGRLQRLAAVYDLTIDDLLPGERQRGLVHVVRDGDGPELKGFGTGLEARLLVRDMARRIQPVRLRLAPGTTHANERGHAGEEFVLVLRGRIELAVDHDDVATLDEGDTAFYPSALSHAYRNPTDEPAELLTISAPNTWFHA